MTVSIYFLSNNPYKIKEMQRLADFEFKAAKLKIDEIQSEDADKIIEDKVLKAYQKLRRPVFVEHSGLYINDFGRLPGGLTQIIWDSLQADKFCEYFGNRPDTSATAKTVIA